MSSIHSPSTTPYYASTDRASAPLGSSRPAKVSAFEYLQDRKVNGVGNLFSEVTSGRWGFAKTWSNDGTRKANVELPEGTLRRTGSLNEAATLGVMRDYINPETNVNDRPSGPIVGSLTIKFEGSKKPIELSEIKFDGGQGDSVGISSENGSRAILPGSIGVLREGDKLTVGVVNQGRFEPLDSVMKRLNLGD